MRWDISEKWYVFQIRQLWDGQLKFLVFFIFFQWTTMLEDCPRGHHLFNTSLCLPVHAWCGDWELSAVHSHLSVSDYSKIFQLTPSLFLDVLIFFTSKYLKERKILKSSFFIFKLTYYIPGSFEDNRIFMLILITATFYVTLPKLEHYLDISIVS